MALFATIYPRDFATGDTFAVKVTSSGHETHTARAGGPWLTAMTAEASLKRDFFDGDFGSPVNAPSASIVLSMDVLTKFHATIARARWAGAKMTIEHWDGGSAQTLFTGVISGFTQQGRTVTLNAEIDTEPFDADVLTATYAGTTGIEGSEDLEGVPKPLLLGGLCEHVEPVLINAVDNVYQVSAYGPIEAVTSLFERGGAFGSPIGNYANYAALIAGDIKEGQWGTCLAQGLIRLGAPAYGVITAHAKGDKPSTWIKRTGAIIKRLAANAGIDAGLIDTASLDAMDAAKPYDIGIYIKDQQSVLQVARRLCLPLNYQAGLDANGKLFALKVTTASPTLTLNGQGAMLPPVTEVAEANASPPYKRIMMGYRKCWRVHTNDEIATEYNLVERGDWDVAQTYREGNIVRMPDGSRWIYISIDAGNTAEPGTNALVWASLSAALTAGDIGGATSAELASALAYIADVEALADGKIDSFYQNDPPASASDGDLWFDTNDGNKQYRRTSGAWVVVQDTAIGTALTNAAGAQATADGKVTTFVGEATPTAEGIGDLWSKPSTGYLFRWSGSSWVSVSNIGATAAQLTQLSQAISDAANAQATADSKIETFYQSTTPSGATLGDLWFKSDENNKLYRHNGAAFVATDDARIASAVTAAAGAQATADGKVTTFIGESAPSAEASGDLWFKASTGELRRWSGSAWGDPLVDLTAAAVPYLEPSSRTINVNANYLGVVDSAALPIGFSVARYRGDTNVSATTTWSIVDKSPADGGTVSVNETGAVSITAVTKSFTFKVRAARDGVTLDALISVVRVDAAPPAPGSGSGSSGTTVFDTSFDPFSGSTAIAVSDLMTVKTGASGQIAFAADLAISTGASSPSGAWNAALQWRYRTIGGSWTNLSEAGAVSSVSCYYDADALGYTVESGQVISSPTVTGLAANTDYEVQLLARRSSGATRTLILSGNAVAAGS